MTNSSSTESAQPHADIQPAASVSRYVEGDGLRLHYLDYGTAGRRPMLCMHGGAAHAHWYDFVAADLSTDHHVRALEHRGHGDSDRANPPAYTYHEYAADMAQAVEKLDLRDFVLIGHSMGGMASLVYASTYPGRVSRLIIVDSTLRLSESFIADSHRRGSRENRPYASLDDYVARFRVRPAGTNAAPGVIRHLARHSARPAEGGGWVHKFDRNVYATRKLINAMECWNRVRIPTLLVKGELSERITPEIVAEVRSRAPHVELTEVANAYHHVMLDNPEGFIAAVRAFLARHP